MKSEQALKVGLLTTYHFIKDSAKKKAMSMIHYDVTSSF